MSHVNARYKGRDAVSDNSEVQSDFPIILPVESCTDHLLGRSSRNVGRHSSRCSQGARIVPVESYERPGDALTAEQNVGGTTAISSGRGPPRVCDKLLNLPRIGKSCQFTPRGPDAQLKTNDPKQRGFVSGGIAAAHSYATMTGVVCSMVITTLLSVKIFYNHFLNYINIINNSKFHLEERTLLITPRAKLLFNSLGFRGSIGRKLLWFCCISAIFSPAHSRPSRHGENLRADDQRVVEYGREREDFPDSTTYLSMFGYLPKSDMETGALRNKSELTNALKKFQRIAHLPVTGRLDEATTTKMRQPRCGMPDDIEDYFGQDGKLRRKRYVLGPSTWPNKHLTYRIQETTRDLSHQQQHEALVSAFRVWSDVTELTFSEVFSGDADMRIKFARGYHHDGYPFDGKGMTLAHAFFPGLDEGGDVHFDDDETWTVHTDQGVNLFIVAAHEMGHALGLAHSSVLGSLMYPWYQGYTPNFSLHSDDLVAIQYLYGRNPRPYPPGPTTTTRGTTPRPRPTPVLPPAFTTPTPVIPTTPSWGPNKPPDPCNTDIDAAAVIRQEVYMFKGLWFWRIDSTGIMDGYPVQVDRFWYNFPKHVDHFDAVYERIDDGKIIFFSGMRYWLFDGNHITKDFPHEGKPLTDMGLPDDIKKIDAAFVWGPKLRTYLITGTMYWGFDEELHRMARDYPRPMSMWEGVPTPVGAAFRDPNDVLYFLKDSSYWRFKDSLMQVQQKEPLPIGPNWLECKETVSDEIGAANIHQSSSSLYLFSLCLVLLSQCNLLITWCV